MRRRIPTVLLKTTTVVAIVNLAASFIALAAHSTALADVTAVLALGLLATTMQAARTLNSPRRPRTHRPQAQHNNDDE